MKKTLVTLALAALTACAEPKVGTEYVKVNEKVGNYAALLKGLSQKVIQNQCSGSSIPSGDYSLFGTGDKAGGSRNIIACHGKNAQVDYARNGESIAVKVIDGTNPPYHSSLDLTVYGGVPLHVRYTSDNPKYDIECRGEPGSEKFIRCVDHVSGKETIAPERKYFKENVNGLVASVSMLEAAIASVEIGEVFRQFSVPDHNVSNKSKKSKGKRK
ncbi:MAG: hypothetical protein WC595_00530 [Candidatus Nanoarchaeia archaeon]